MPRRSLLYIEDDNSVLGPLNADLTVLRIGKVLEEEFEHSVAFFFLEADDVCSIRGK